MVAVVAVVAVVVMEVEEMKRERERERERMRDMRIVLAYLNNWRLAYLGTRQILLLVTA